MSVVGEGGQSRAEGAVLRTALKEQRGWVSRVSVGCQPAQLCVCLHLGPIGIPLRDTDSGSVFEVDAEKR